MRFVPSRQPQARPRWPLTWRRTLSVGFILALGCSPSSPREDLKARLQTRIAGIDAEVVSVYFKDLTTGDSLLLDADVRVHAASMMKVPVLIQLFRDADAGLLRLDDSLTLTNTFKSIVDGSPFELGATDDADTTLYERLGDRESVLRLAELMITVSSNLATNILIERLGADRVQQTMRDLGADSIAVRRGVEDTKAYRAGLNNTTTARDLGVIFSAIAEARAAAAGSCQQMIDILARQQFNDGIPAVLPPGTRVAHKTGSITAIRHDGGIIYPEGQAPFVLVVLTKGIAESTAADRLIAYLARLTYERGEAR